MLEFSVESNSTINYNISKMETSMKELTDSILTVKQFTSVIETMVSKMDCTYLEALTKYAEDNGIEIETIGSLVKGSHVLKAKLAAESEELRLLKPSGAKLPIDDD